MMDDFETELDDPLPRMPLSTRNMVMLTPEELKAIIDEAVAEATTAEREACAQIVEDEVGWEPVYTCPPGHPSELAWFSTLDVIAEAIRARENR